ncbi:MAG TPA: pyridoxal-dependent decarboxylase [Solirubrobacter sp.]|nr:pyridoxal-dependent decarboxylase [Solirubrobacter sp.]
MDYLARALEAAQAWRAPAGPLPAHPSLDVDPERFETAFAEFSSRMAGSYPFHHPRYAGQMLKPPHPVAIAAYTAALHVNANNHALDGGPVTSALEVEVVRDLADMFGLPDDALGHLTSSGTIANLEALWVARELHPGRAVAFGPGAHYTHARMCAVLGVEGIVTGDLRAACASGRVGTIVVTAGTTGLGTVDDVGAALALREEFGVRVHVDAAYGGFFTLLDALVPVDRFRAIAGADSVVVDPHKHGLQPYGCGAVLFRDPAVGRLYKHDSPYTYFTSAELHLGEISLECSRAGAAAAALWLTLRSLDLAPILEAGVRAARAWASLLREPGELRLHVEPELDILTYFPARARASEIDAASAAVLDAGMHADDPVYLSTLWIDGAAFAAAHPDVELDADGVRVLRSVLMKPEHEPHVPWLHERVSAIAAATR